MRCELHCSCRRHSVVEVDDAKVREGLDHAEQEEDAERDAVPAQRSGCWLEATTKKKCSTMLRLGATPWSAPSGQPVPLCPPGSVPAASPSTQPQSTRAGARWGALRRVEALLLHRSGCWRRRREIHGRRCCLLSLLVSLLLHPKPLESAHAARCIQGRAPLCKRARCGAEVLGHWCARAKRTRAAEPASRDSGSSGRRRQASTQTWHPAAPPSTSARGKSLR